MADSVVCTYVPSERVPKRKEGEEEEGRKLEDGEEATAAAVEEESEISASLSLSLSLSLVRLLHTRQIARPCSTNKLHHRPLMPRVWSDSNQSVENELMDS